MSADWKSVDSQAELDELDAQVNWEDAECVRYHADGIEHDYFPGDVSRTGYAHKNVHILLALDTGANLRMVFLHCEVFTSSFAENAHMRGRLDALRRVEILSDHDDPQMRCARVIWRIEAAHSDD